MGIQREQIVKLTLDGQLNYFSQLLNESGRVPEELIDLYERATVLRLEAGDRLCYFNRIRNAGHAIPQHLSDLYEMTVRAQKSAEISVEMGRLKSEWISTRPEFKSISDHMTSFQTSDTLIAFRKAFPGESLNDRVLSTYKKCISYRQKLTKQIKKNLIFSATTPTKFYAASIYCINRQIVYSFLGRYLSWRDEIYPYWNKIFTEVSTFNGTSDFHVDYWKRIVRWEDQLTEKAEYIARIHGEVVRLLDNGSNLLHQLDDEITSEYNRFGIEMSLYERELEIARLSEGEQISDEEYCYVYTIECVMGVFYVGLAADPKERLEQHIRGAFADEAHLFKSKFIQKYHNGITQKIVFEGTRRECRRFERDYISKHLPLGNMTQGGEG